MTLPGTPQPPGWAGAELSESGLSEQRLSVGGYYVPRVCLSVLTRVYCVSVCAALGVRVHVNGCYPPGLAFLFVPFFVQVGTWEHGHVCIVKVVCMYVGGRSMHTCVSVVCTCASS